MFLDRSQISLEELFSRAWKTGCLTDTEQQKLREKLLEKSVTQDEQSTIERLLHATRRGWLKVI
ncbi:MAG: hypothetical protein SWY16_15790 [Cyanobacteriota bacterium]|nr:hypothetical protein [Cyanobacteriota bacterium]